MDYAYAAELLGFAIIAGIFVWGYKKIRESLDSKKPTERPPVVTPPQDRDEPNKEDL